MSRIPKLVSAGLVMGSLAFPPAANLQAQNSPKRKPATRGPIQPVQVADDEPEVEAPLPRPKSKGRSAPPTGAGAEKGDGPAREQLPLPEAQPMRIPKLSPEMEKILADWETSSSQIKTMTGKFTRHKYDHTFKVDFYATGKFAYEAPDKGAYELEGVRIDADAVSDKLDADKVPYSLKSDQSEHWVCTGAEVYQINHKEKNYIKATIPPEHQGENIIDGPLPFLFGMKAEQAKRRYGFKPFDLKGKAKEKYRNAICLIVTPRLAKDSANWEEAYIIINPSNYLPVAVRLVSPGGNTETVHQFSDLKVNGRASLLDFFGKKDPFKPDIRNYQPVLSEKSAPAQVPSPSSPDISTRPGTPTGPRGRAATGPADRDLPRSADSSGGLPKKPARTTRN